MAKIRTNSELLRIMDKYVLFMDSKKQAEMPLVVSQIKQNHPSSLYKEVSIKSESSFGCVTMDCEIRNKDHNNYSIQLVSDMIKNKVLSRLDEGNGTHRNALSTIPLQEQMVSTPHFHIYTKNGLFFAYQTENLKSYNEKPMPIEVGIHEFCQEMNIHSTDEHPIDVIVQEEGVLALDFGIDPLEGIKL